MAECLAAGRRPPYDESEHGRAQQCDDDDVSPVSPAEHLLGGVGRALEALRVLQQHVALLLDLLQLLAAINGLLYIPPNAHTGRTTQKEVRRGDSNRSAALCRSRCGFFLCAFSCRLTHVVGHDGSDFSKFRVDLLDALAGRRVAVGV